MTEDQKNRRMRAMLDAVAKIEKELEALMPEPEPGAVSGKSLSIRHLPQPTIGEVAAMHAKAVEHVKADLRKRGRPPTTGRTPDAERKRKSRQAQAAQGGKLISTTIGPAAAEALGIVMLLEGLGEKEAIEHALQRTASLAQRREKARKP